MACTSYNAAQELDSRRDELLGQVQGGVDHGLAPRLIGDHGSHFIDELAHRLDRSLPAGFDRFEHVIGQVGSGRPGLLRSLGHDHAPKLNGSGVAAICAPRTNLRKLT